MSAEFAYSTRTFAAGSFEFVVRCDDPDVRDVVDRLFCDLPDATGTIEEFLVAKQPHGYQLLGPGPWTADFMREGDTVLNDLVAAVNRARLDAEPNLLHLHAALASFSGGAVLIVAPSGTGKSTLVTSLALDGWTYVTDEATSLALGDPAIGAFPKPVTLKQPGTEFFPMLAEHRVSLVESDPWLWNVPLGPAGVATALSAEPTLIVLLSRGSDATPAWEPVRPADAVVALAEQTLDLDRYGHEGLRTLAELCARSPCVHVATGAPSSTAALVQELASGSEALDLEVMSIATAAPDPSVSTNEIEAVTLDGDLVLRQTANGQLISLNSAGAAIWAAMSAESGPGELDQESLAFAKQLATMGFLEIPRGIVG